MTALKCHVVRTSGLSRSPRTGPLGPCDPRGRIASSTEKGRHLVPVWAGTEEQEGVGPQAKRLRASCNDFHFSELQVVGKFSETAKHSMRAHCYFFLPFLVSFEGDGLYPVVLRA